MLSSERVLFYFIEQRNSWFEKKFWVVLGNKKIVEAFFIFGGRGQIFLSNFFYGGGGGELKVKYGGRHPT